MRNEWPRIVFRPLGAIDRFTPAGTPVIAQLRGVAQFGRALALGARGRRFKSCYPDGPDDCKRPVSSWWFETPEELVVLCTAARLWVRVPPVPKRGGSSIGRAGRLYEQHDGLRGRGAVGSASEWHSEGQGFEPPRLHWRLRAGHGIRLARTQDVLCIIVTALWRNRYTRWTTPKPTRAAGWLLRSAWWESIWS